MSIELDALGKRFGPFHLEYTPRDTGIYALAVGADESELAYFLRERGPLVVPSFGIVPAFQAAVAILPELGIAGKPIVHATQGLEISGPIPPRGKLETTLTVKGIYDKGSGALFDFECRTRVDGKDLCENTVGYFVMGEGGFGGERGPKAEKIKPPDRPPDHRLPMRMNSTQSILYSLSFLPDPAMERVPPPKAGDAHIDPEAARALGFDGPLLHGICTLGFLTCAAIREVLAGDPTSVKGLHGRFAAPVHPGQSLVTELWEETGRLVARMMNEKGAAVLSDGVVELR